MYQPSNELQIIILSELAKRFYFHQIGHQKLAHSNQISDNLVLSAKKKSVRCIVALITINKVNFCILLICGHIFLLNINLKIDIFEGTVLEGIMYRSKYKWICAFNDIHYYKNIPTSRNIFLQKLSRIKHIVTDKYKYSQNDEIHFQLGKYVFLNHLRLINHSCTVVFRSNYEQFEMEFVKKKPLQPTESQTLTILKTPKHDVYKIKETNDILCVSSAFMSSYLKRLFIFKSEVKHVCKYNKLLNGWSPVC